MSTSQGEIKAVIGKWNHQRCTVKQLVKQLQNATNAAVQARRRNTGTQAERTAELDRLDAEVVRIKKLIDDWGDTIDHLDRLGAAASK